MSATTQSEEVEDTSTHSHSHNEVASEEGTATHSPTHSHTHSNPEPTHDSVDQKPDDSTELLNFSDDEDDDTQRVSERVKERVEGGAEESFEHHTHSLHTHSHHTQQQTITNKKEEIPATSSTTKTTHVRPTTSHTHSSTNDIPRFLRPTKSFSAPKMVDIKEEFPDSPASKRGIMLKITPKSADKAFDSIFLYDDKVKEPKEEDKYDMRYKDRESIPRLFRPTLCSLALPETVAEANSITKRGTMMKSQGIRYTSKFEMLVEEAQKSDLEKAKLNKKPPIPRDAFENTVLPSTKGHTFATAVPPKKDPVPAELFSECVKSPLRDRMSKIAELEYQEKPPRVMKNAVPFAEFTPSPVKKPPVVNDNKPIKSIKQLHHFIKNKVVIAEMKCEEVLTEWFRIIDCELKGEIEAAESDWNHEISAMSRYSTATPQRRLHNKLMQQSVSASHFSSCAGSLTTEQDILRSKKLMDCSVAMEFNRSRMSMSRAKVDCVKDIKYLKAYASEAIGVVRKLFDRYISTTRKAGQRSSESYTQYATCLQNFDKLVPSAKKDSHRKRLHLVADQQTTVMCSSLQKVDEILHNLDDIKVLLQKERNVGDYCFQEANPVHFFPDYLQKFFANPIVAPSKMNLKVKRAHKKKKRTKKKTTHGEYDSSRNKKNNNNNNNDTDDINCVDNSVFDISDDEDVDENKEIVVDRAYFNDIGCLQRLASSVYHQSISELSNTAERNITRQHCSNTTESVLDKTCINEGVSKVVVVKQLPDVVSRQAFTHFESLFDDRSASRRIGGQIIEGGTILEKDTLPTFTYAGQSSLDSSMQSEVVLGPRSVLSSDGIRVNQPPAFIVSDTSETESPWWKPSWTQGQETGGKSGRDLSPVRETEQQSKINLREDKDEVATMRTKDGAQKSIKLKIDYSFS